MTRVASSAGTMYWGLRWLTLSTMVLKWVKWSWKVSFLDDPLWMVLKLSIMVLKWGTTFDLTRLYSLITRFGLIFDAFGGWSWNDTFACPFLHGGYHFSSLNGLERSLLMSQTCFSVFSMGFLPSIRSGWSWKEFLVLSLVVFSIAKTDFDTFLHKTLIKPNLMLAGWPTMIGFSVLVSTM